MMFSLGIKMRFTGQSQTQIFHTMMIWIIRPTMAYNNITYTNNIITPASLYLIDGRPKISRSWIKAKRRYKVPIAFQYYYSINNYCRQYLYKLISNHRHYNVQRLQENEQNYDYGTFIHFP